MRNLTKSYWQGRITGNRQRVRIASNCGLHRRIKYDDDDKPSHDNENESKNGAEFVDIAFEVVLTVAKVCRFQKSW